MGLMSVYKSLRTRTVYLRTWIFGQNLRTDAETLFRDPHVSAACPFCQSHRQVFSIGIDTAYSAKYNALVAYKIPELFQLGHRSHTRIS